ncbi:MAG: ArnT family glycosyltransferase [Phycisphaerae bacterium]
MSVSLPLTPPPALPLRGTLPLMIEREPVWRMVSFATVVAVAVVLFWCRTGAYWVAAHPGADQNGYLVAGKQLAGHFSAGFAPADPYQFVGRMWVTGGDPAGDGVRYFPKYPLGYPLLVALMVFLGAGTDGYGASWAYAVGPACAGLALPAIFLLARQIGGSLAGLVALLIVATSPLTLVLANSCNAHAASFCMTAWGAYLLVRWWQRGGALPAAGAGALLGYAAITRYADGLLILPALLVVAFNLRPGRGRSWGEAAWLVGCWLAPVLLQLAVNRATLGYWTGYGPTKESDAFAWANLAQNWDAAVRQLNNSAMFLSFPLGVLGLLLLAARSTRLALVLAAWAVPPVLLAAAYYWRPGDESVTGYGRFFLTAIAPLAVGAAWCLARGFQADARPTVSNRAARWFAAPAGAALILAGAVGQNWGAASVAMDVEYRKGRAMEVAANEILGKERAPAGATVFAPRDMLNHLQFKGVDLRLYDVELFTRAGVHGLSLEKPDGPGVFQYERARAMHDRLKGKSDAQLQGIARQIAGDTLADGRRAFVVTPPGGALKRAMADAALERSDKRRLAVKSVAGWTEPAIRGVEARWELVEIVGK